jgi:uncharacterized membrane protein YdjX (TVP38/TMEM64 family)
LQHGKISETGIKIAAGIFLAGSILAIHLFDPVFFPEIWRLTVSGDVEDLVRFLRPYGFWAMLVSLLIDVLINALGFLPSIFVSTANGILFGIIPGIIISWFAESIGVIIGFFLMRSVLRHSAELLISQSSYLKKVDEFSSRNGFKMMLLARAVPYFPSGIITALGAISSMRIRDYVFATFIGKFPSTSIEVVVGHDIVTYQEHTFRLFVVVMIVCVFYGGLWWRYNKRKKEQIDKQVQPDDTSDG